MRQVAIIGQAWRTPLGGRIDEAIARACAGDRAIVRSRTGGYACSLVAPIAGEPAKSRQARFLRRMGLFGLEVAREAVVAARATHANALAEGTRVGLFAGVGGLRAHWDDMLKALEHQAEDGAGAWERGLRDVHPYWMLRHLSNNVHALAAMELGFKGEGATYGGATGGAQALAAATRALHVGAIDAALIVAYDSLLEPETLVELGAKRAATQATDPAAVAAAYDPRAAGFVPGEAAAALVLVRPTDAHPPLALIAATAGADGERQEPHPHTLGTAIATLGLERARASELVFVDGAAAAWPDRDDAERSLLAERGLAGVPLTALTSAFGQLGAATAVVQAIALGELLRRGALPPLAGAGTPASSARPTAALALSTGAPGLAAAIHVEVRPTAERSP